MPSKCRTPKFDMLPTSTFLVQSHHFSVMARGRRLDYNLGQNISRVHVIQSACDDNNSDFDTPSPPSTTYQSCSVVRFLVKRSLPASRLEYYTHNNIDLRGRGNGRCDYKLDVGMVENAAVGFAKCISRKLGF